MLKLIIYTALLSNLLISDHPTLTIQNSNRSYSLLNSIHFHPTQNIFCVSYTQNNKIYIFKIEEDLSFSILQILSNPKAKLKAPQHSAFSPKGNYMACVNWADCGINLYEKLESGLFAERPTKMIPSHPKLYGSKPHGLAFSPSGSHLAIAYGASSAYKNALALFKCDRENISCIDVLRHSKLIGIPKGICFTPDGENLLVSFAEPSLVQIFQVENEKINPIPLQTLFGAESGLSRPEDIKISPDGQLCAVSNSSANSVCFFHFDPQKNRIINRTPFKTLRNLSFPHGIAFSFDSKFLGITQFGSIETTLEGDVKWSARFPPEEGTIQIFKIEDFSD